MSENVLLRRPTARDEDWRYADPAFLAEGALESMVAWGDLRVPAGETLRDHVMIGDGASAPGAALRHRVHVEAGGRFEYFAVLAGGPYLRHELQVTLERGAHFEFGGATLGGGSKVQEIVTRVIHAAPDATSNQVVRAVQWGQATGNFLGRIDVVRDAQKTDAAQNFRAILLERGATANARPQLEIFADDVKCAHGAAIGTLDPSAAFYLAARGIPPELARRLQIQAFLADAFQAAGPQLGDSLLDWALGKLDGGAA